MLLLSEYRNEESEQILVIYTSQDTLHFGCVQCSLLTQAFGEYYRLCKCDTCIIPKLRKKVCGRERYTPLFRHRAEDSQSDSATGLD